MIVEIIAALLNRDARESWSRGNTIAVVVISSAAIAGFTVLDQGLSGGSAQDPRWAIGYIVVGAGLVAYLLTGTAGVWMQRLALVHGLLPLVLALGYCGLTAAHQRDMNAPKREAADNVACATEKAGIEEQDRKFVRARIGMIRDWGPNAFQQEIEERMGIQILPGCQFERTSSLSAARAPTGGGVE